jgi:hypothetical protein
MGILEQSFHYRSIFSSIQEGWFQLSIPITETDGDGRKMTTFVGAFLGIKVGLGGLFGQCLECCFSRLDIRGIIWAPRKYSIYPTLAISKQLRMT